MVGAGEMNQADLAGVLHTIAQQQTAIFQQQTVLLQVHSETIRLQKAARRAHAQQPGGRRCSDTRTDDGARRVDATAHCRRSIAPTACTRYDNSSSNRNTSSIAADGKPVAYSGCSRTPGKRSTARCASYPTAQRKCAACRSVLPADVGRTLPLTSLATGSGTAAQTARDRRCEFVDHCNSGRTRAPRSPTSPCVTPTMFAGL